MPLAIALTIFAAVAQAGSLGTPTVLATPAFPSPVSAVGGIVAWAAPYGSGSRFEIVVRSSGQARALSTTSAVGWIDSVKLGTDATGHSIVVYSRCPYSFANGTSGHAGTDSCRLWWVSTSGGGAHRINAAPPDTSIGVAVHGSVVFAVQPNTAQPNQPARIETARLTGSSAQPLAVPTPDGATIDDLSSNGTQVAFSEAPSTTTPSKGVSELWLDGGSGAPELIAKVVFDGNPIDDDEHFYDGVTLTSGFLYAFLYAQRNVYPPVASALERISLTGLPSAVSAWSPGTSLSAYGIGAAAFDPGDSQLILSLFSAQVDFSTVSAACSTHAGSAKSCPVVQTGPVTFN